LRVVVSRTADLAIFNLPFVDVKVGAEPYQHEPTFQQAQEIDAARSLAQCPGIALVIL
jgi:hypothetical protein